MTAKQLASKDTGEDDDFHPLSAAERRLIDFLLDDPPENPIFISLDANFHREPNYNSNPYSLGYSS